MKTGRPPEILSKETITSNVLIAENGCWLWQGHKDKDGYGQITRARRRARAHRLSMHLFKGFDLDSKLYLCVKEKPQTKNEGRPR